MNFTKIGVVGAGTMGSGIAQKIAQSNIPVVLVDLEQKFLDKGLNNIKSLLQEGVSKKIFTQDKVNQALNHITATTDFNRLKDADLVIEAVFEDKNVKINLFKNLDSICQSKTILASNTSSFSISELAGATKRPDRFAGLHYFYHPAKNRLLEIIPGQKTSSETLERTVDFSNLTGKTGIVVRDSAGFVVNRFFVPWLNEAVRILEEGIADIPTIDEAAKRAFKIGMGPFLLMNVTGIPIAYHSADTLGNEFGPFYTPSCKLKEQFESKREWNLEGAADESKIAVVQERLLGIVFLVSGQLVDEGVGTKEDIDLGAKVGLRWSLGPFELMNKIGIDKSVQLVKTIAEKYGLKIPRILEEQRQKKNPWQFKRVDLSVKDGVATITINRPEALNALNEEVIRQLDETFRRAESDKNVKAIVLAGKGKAFVAGADIGFFVKNIEGKNIDKIVEFTGAGQELLLRIDKTKKLVIAVIDGLALGGGAELALAADVRLMTERGSLGFPETGIGIYPGLAGTQRLPRLVGKALAKYLIFTGEIISAAQAQAMGLAEFVPVAEIKEAINRKIQGETTHPLPLSRGDYEKIKNLFERNENITSWLNGQPVEMMEESLARISKKVLNKAPVALKLANQLIDEGLKTILEEGIKLELAHLPEIFATRDAYEGLTSILQRRKPVFEGR